MRRLSNLRALTTLTGTGTHPVQVTYTFLCLLENLHIVYFLCHIFVYVSSKIEMHFLLPSAVHCVNDLSRMHEKGPVRHDIFQVSEAALSDTAISSCHPWPALLFPI